MRAICRAGLVPSLRVLSLVPPARRAALGYMETDALGGPAEPLSGTGS